MRAIRSPAPLEGRSRGIGGAASEQYTAAADIAHALEARQVSPGKWMARCPAHEDRAPSLSIRDGHTAPLVHCFAGCDRADVIEALRDRGLWPYRPRQGGRSRRRRLDVDALWRETAEHLVRGTRPVRCPPYTRSLPEGEVWVMAGPDAWGAARLNRDHGRHALVLPPGAPYLAYRWPVRGRQVRVFDTADDPLAGQWFDTLQDFSRDLVSRWHAARVELFGTFEPVCFLPEGASHAA